MRHNSANQTRNQLKFGNEVFLGISTFIYHLLPSKRYRSNGEYLFKVTLLTVSHQALPKMGGGDCSPSFFNMLNMLNKIEKNYYNLTHGYWSKWHWLEWLLAEMTSASTVSKVLKYRGK